MKMKKEITYKEYSIWISSYYYTLIRYYIPKLRGKIRGQPVESNIRRQKFQSDGSFEI